MITNDEKILKEMRVLRNWKPETYRLYVFSLESYTNFHKLSMYELIQEAESDEETTHKVNKRRIKQRLTDYQLAMIHQKLTNNSINTYLANIKQIYKYHDIEIPTINNLRVRKTEKYEDLPTKKEIKHAINQSRTKMKAIITFIASSGLRRSDVANLTINDFIKATRKYHHSNNIRQVLTELSYQNHVVPTWNITSIKTEINHITFNSSECTQFIIQMLNERLMKHEIRGDEPLFDGEAQNITISFHNTNDRLGFGWKDHRRRFTPHALRKYFSTALTGDDMDLLSCEFLMGHTIDGVKSSYYFSNPEKLKNKYIRHMNVLTFVDSVNFIDIDSREKRELQELKQYKRESFDKINRLEEMVNLLSQGFVQ